MDESLVEGSKTNKPARGKVGTRDQHGCVHEDKVFVGCSLVCRRAQKESHTDGSSRKAKVFFFLIPVILDFDRPVLVGLPRLSHTQGAMISGRALFEAH